MRSSWSAVALVLLVLLLSTPALARADSHLEPEVRAIARLLKCPVCQNLSVADSPSPLAGQMRDLVRSQLAAGQSREQILTYFVDRYGEEILLDPPRVGFGQLVWWGAALIPLAGLVIVALHLRGWLRRPLAAPSAALGLSPAELAAYEVRLEAELAGAPDRSP